MLIAKYTCNTNGIVPTFNSGYVYEVNEVENEGIYTVEITSEDDFSSCSFNGKSQLLTVEYLKVTTNVTNMSSMFSGCNNLAPLDVSNWNTSKVTDMQGMFNCCYKLTSLDLSSWDTNKVTDMAYMFYSCNNLTSLDSMQNIPVSLSLSATKLDQTSLVDVINNLVTVTTTQTLTLGTTLLAKLTEEQIVVAVNKGWTVE